MKKLYFCFMLLMVFFSSPLTVSAQKTDVKNENIIEITPDDYTNYETKKLVELLYNYKELKDKNPKLDVYSDTFEDIAREIANRNNIYDYYILEVDALCTYYDSCYNCCNKEMDSPGYKKTASGKTAVEGKTAALDKSIPFGSLAISTDFIDTKDKYPFDGVLIKHDVGGGIKNFKKDGEDIYKIDIYVDAANENNECGVFKHNYSKKKGLHESPVILIINNE